MLYCIYLFISCIALYTLIKGPIAPVENGLKMICTDMPLIVTPTPIDFKLSQFKLEFLTVIQRFNLGNAKILFLLKMDFTMHIYVRGGGEQSVFPGQKKNSVAACL